MGLLFELLKRKVLRKEKSMNITIEECDVCLNITVQVYRSYSGLMVGNKVAFSYSSLN